MAQVMCKRRVLVALKAGTVRTVPGKVYDAKSPVVKAAPNAFEPLEKWTAQQTVVEQATAAPGESRSVKKPKKAKADADA